jgi:iron complex transport system ATP-binding protein
MAAEVSIEGVTWGPSPHKLLIEDISFHVAPKSITAIVGANGAGKSTLLRCIYRFYAPLSGQVRIDGVRVAGLKPREAARIIAVVLQEPTTDFPFTVRDVVKMGRIPHDGHNLTGSDLNAEIVQSAMTRLRIDHLVDAPMHQLSGGEKQRVLLARALAQQPQLIVLDEPTNHLDIRNQLELLAILRKLDVTIVMTVHDLAMAAHIADQVVVLHEGKVIASGPPMEALTAPVIHRAFGVVATVVSPKPVPGDSGGAMFSFVLPPRPDGSTESRAIDG